MRGAALTEYGLLVGLVAIVAIGAVSTLGAKTRATFSGVTDELAASIGDGTSGPVGNIASWTMASEVGSAYGMNFYGYLGPGSAIEIGSLAMEHGPFVVTAQYSREGVSVDSEIYLTGDWTQVLGPDTVLRCAELFELAIGDATAVQYFQDNDKTRYLWTGVPQYQAGVDYTCGFHDPGA